VHTALATKIDTQQLRASVRFIAGTLKSTPAQWLPAMNAIAHHS